MRAIFEEVENDIARLIPDDGSDLIEINRSKLPRETVLGDVFEIYYETEQRKIIEKVVLIPNERTKRLEKSKTKRELLLRKTSEKD